MTVNRETGRVEEMDPYRFRSYVEDHMVCFVKKWKDEESGKDKYLVKTMGVDIARSTLASDVFRYQQRRLQRVNQVRLPVMRKDGRIELLPEGYDEESETLTVKSGIDYNEEMTLEEAKAIIDDLLKEFPFGDWKADNEENRAANTVGQSRSKAVSVAAMLSVFGAGLQSLTARRLNFIYTANSVGSGKTLLGQVAIVPVIGSSNVQVIPDSKEEFRKVLDTEALNASPVIFFDEVDGFVKYPMLNAFMTAPIWTGRLMNSQKKFTAPKVSTVFLAGNNLDTSPDIARRSLRANLYVEEANVQDREIKKVIDDEYLARPDVRKQILSALWAMVKSWDQKRRPAPPRVQRGYEPWSFIFGGIVYHAGFGDALEQPSQEEAGDPEIADMNALVAALASANIEKGTNHGEFEFSEIVDCARSINAFEYIMDGREQKDKESGEVWFEMTSKARSVFGKLLGGKFGGRVFMVKVKNGEESVLTRVRFGVRGKNRQRRYAVTIGG
ncbi:MAG: hypothetical protein B9S32_13930 [Verrucomicrobia bacterium Tous-C9LFEB]|nr:MAG: hypothetical protein B9S32_13930 [Verrucomicrobia bacterium Tous-C9LFEB]